VMCRKRVFVGSGHDDVDYLRLQEGKKLFCYGLDALVSQFRAI
jgi:hypothetical protein